MILFELKCDGGHGFEAWFHSGAAFDRQKARGLVTCPECGDKRVEKAPMAPRLARAKAEPAPAPEAVKALAELRQNIEKNCEHVGDRFAEEARKIHYGEGAKRNIYGDATDDQARELADEGVEFRRIPWLKRRDC